MFQGRDQVSALERVELFRCRAPPAQSEFYVREIDMTHRAYAGRSSRIVRYRASSLAPGRSRRAAATFQTAVASVWSSAVLSAARISPLASRSPRACACSSLSEPRTTLDRCDERAAHQ